MGIVNPSAGNSKFLNHKDRVLIGLRGDRTEEPSGATEGVADEAAEERDNFSLSNDAQALLSESSDLITKLLESYPQFEYNFPKDGESKGLGLLGSMRSFLAQPHNTKRAENDPKFGSFYRDLESLENRSHAALELMQSTIRAQDRTNYSNLKNQRG